MFYVISFTNLCVFRAEVMRKHLICDALNGTPKCMYLGTGGTFSFYFSMIMTLPYYNQIYFT
jgi:hypothetical protein